MSLSKRIPVTEEVWKELAEMRAAGQTYNDLLAEMIELRKKRRLLDDINNSLQEDDFVPPVGDKIVSFRVLVRQKSIDAINELPAKTRMIISDALKGLEKPPARCRWRQRETPP